MLLARFVHFSTSFQHKLFVPCSHDGKELWLLVTLDTACGLHGRRPARNQFAPSSPVCAYALTSVPGSPSRGRVHVHLFVLVKLTVPSMVHAAYSPQKAPLTDFESARGVRARQKDAPTEIGPNLRHFQPTVPASVDLTVASSHSLLVINLSSLYLTHPARPRVRANV